MTLAIFDLDDTLIAGDSASLWLHFLVEEGLADSGLLPREAEMMRAYHQGRLEMDDYMRVTLAPLAGRPTAEIAQWAARFIERVIAPIVYPQARDLIAAHRAEGRRCLVISATGEHVVKPIAASLGIFEALGVELAVRSGRYDGGITGIPTYRQGKVDRLRQWLEQTGERLEGSHGYSDSVNDIPLLEAVDHPFAVNPDQRLSEHAARNRWPRLDWRPPAASGYQR